MSELEHQLLLLGAAVAFWAIAYPIVTAMLRARSDDWRDAQRGERIDE